MGRRGRTVPHRVQPVRAATLNPASQLAVWDGTWSLGTLGSCRGLQRVGTCLPVTPGGRPVTHFRAAERWRASASVASRVARCLGTRCHTLARSEALAAVYRCQLVSGTLSRDVCHAPARSGALAIGCQCRLERGPLSRDMLSGKPREGHAVSGQAVTHRHATRRWQPVASVTSQVACCLRTGCHAPARGEAVEGQGPTSTKGKCADTHAARCSRGGGGGGGDNLNYLACKGWYLACKG